MRGHWCGISQLLVVSSLFHPFHVPPYTQAEFASFRAPKFNHATGDVSNRTNDVLIVQPVIVGDADGVADTDRIESVVPYVGCELPLLTFTLHNGCDYCSLSTTGIIYRLLIFSGDFLSVYT